jgi:hypothetical protein
MSFAVTGVATAEAEILKITDPTDANFRGWPSNDATVAANWARIARLFFATQSFPTGVVVDSVQVPAEQAFITAMVTELALNTADRGAKGIDAGFTAYAAQVAAGSLLLPAGIITCTPPLAALGIASKITGVTSDPSGPAATMAAALAAWAMTGTATQGTTTGPWA